MEIMVTSKNYGKEKGSDHFRDILNPYGEKSNYVIQLWKIQLCNPIMEKSDADAACLS